MAWRHYEVRQSHDYEVQETKGVSLTRFEMGIVETGRTRVFAGHFIRLMLSDREPIIGEDEHSLRAALWRLARNIEPLGLTLNCVGLSAEFNESGLSMDTGWGYWGRHSEPMHMMDPLPLEEDHPENLDKMIREAVDSMKIDLNFMRQPVPDRSAHGVPRKAAQGQAAPLSSHRAPSPNRGPAYSMKNAPRTHR